MKFALSFFVTAALTLTLHTSLVHAQEAAAPEKAEESVRPDDAIFHHVPQNLQDQFASNVFFHGQGSQTGGGVAIETPFAWNALALRLGASWNSVSFGPDADRIFYSGQLAVKFQADLLSSANIYPYTLVAYDFFFGSIEGTGTRSAVEVMFGADWRFVSTPVFRKDERIVRAFFIEAGPAISDFQLSNGNSEVPVSDGFMGRIGFRTFL